MTTGNPRGAVPDVSRYASFGIAPFGMALVAAALAAGLWFRFTGLDRKYFWFDEGHSAACVSGRPVQAIDGLFDGVVRPWRDLQEFLHLRPGEPLTTTVRALADGNPENAPLYFLLLRCWAELAGDSAAQLRALSALFSVLSAPLLYWLCRELFDSRRTAWTAVVWWSLSPLFVLYAQEARTYSLFALLSIFNGAALVRAVRTGSSRAWTLYAAATALGLYTHMFFATLVIAEAVYIVAFGLGESGPERRRLWTRFFAAASVGVGLFLPWFALFVSRARHGELSEFLADRIGIHKLAVAWIENVGAVLFDFGLTDFPGARFTSAAIALAVVLGIGWSLRFLVRSTPRRTWMFVVTLSLTPPLLFVVSDLLLGNSRSQVARYWLPAYIGMGIAISHGIGAKLAERTTAGRLLAAALVAAAAVSCYRSSQASTWWNKGALVGSLEFFLREDRVLRSTLTEIARSPRPVVVVEHDPLKSFELLAMSTLVDPKIEWMGVRDPETVELPADRDLFLYRSPALADRLKSRGMQLTSLEYSGKFQRVESSKAAD